MSNEDIITSLISVKGLIEDFNDPSKQNILGSAGNALMEQLNSQKNSLMREYVNNLHHNKISPPTEAICYYVTRVDGKKIRAKSLDALYEKLFIAYGGESLLTKTFGSVFAEALGAKAKLRDYNTIYKYKKDFERFITPELSEMPIRKISNAYLKEYTADMVNRLKPLPKAYAAYKSVLNLAFTYAVSNDWLDTNVAEKLVDSDYKTICKQEYRSAEQKAMSPEQIAALSSEVRKRIEAYKKQGKILTTGYMFLLSTFTGMRAGELCSLSWDDVNFEERRIHIHTQQRKVGKEYVYTPWSKNEKGIPKGGRYYPVTDEINLLLRDLRQTQENLQIKSKWVFCDAEGDWIKKDTCYDKFLRRLCTSLGYSLTNNHAIRMYLNSYVLIPKGVNVADRAKLLGHSVDVNFKNYSFADYNYCDNVGALLDRPIEDRQDNLVDFNLPTIRKAL